MSGLRTRIEAGQILFRQGEIPDSAFLIESGEVEVRVRQGDTEVVLSILGEGDLVGEMAVIDDSYRTATATAITDCVLYRVDRRQIGERLVAADPIIRALLEGQLKRYRGALAALQGQSLPDTSTPSEQLGIDKIRLETQLREALAGHALELSYQPILDIPADRIAGYEALVRWQHPERGPVSPAEFVALAEETSLIVPIGEYVIDVACAAVSRFARAGVDPVPFVAVNVSARQLVHPGLVERILARVHHAGLPAGSLKLEITESRALDIELVARVIELCQRHGIRVALDDFGTGYSHFGQLHRLHFDTVKLDRSFAHAMLADPRAMAIIEHLAELGRALRTDIVVEGVETGEQLAELRRIGCRYAQGYLIGRPRALGEWLASA
ncbi:EAL domain-containing protein [Arenimonas composti]|nr:EAL domain-containing protein [Arenimonas composti]